MNTITDKPSVSPESTTPLSPNTPSSVTNDDIPQEYKQNDDIMCTLRKIGFNDGTKLLPTLQGMIWKAEKVNKLGEIESSVIKITNKFLHANSAALVKNKLYTVSEDILSEQSILKYLTEDKECPNSIVKFQGFFQTKTDYWLMMEDGGSSLFDFAMKAHQLIRSNCMDLSEWKKLVLVILKQMIECIEYIHSKNVAHFDISLENFLINDIKVDIERDATDAVVKVKFITDNIQIKLCDFGLAQKFAKSHFMSTKFCGKDHYKSPEVSDKKNVFNAKKNDIWCFGVATFILLTGLIPWEIAHESDVLFVFAMNNSIYQLLKYWNIQHYVGRNLVFLLESIFQYENDRINLNDFKKYFYQFVDIV